MDEHPTIVIDIAEPNDSEAGRKNGTPLPFAFPTVVKHLYTGDYSILGCETIFAIERKTIADLVASVTRERERFERELLRLRSMDFGRLLIVGAKRDIVEGRYRSKTNPLSVINTLAAFTVRYSSVMMEFAPDEAAAARKIEGWASWFFREKIIQHKAMMKGVGVTDIPVESIEANGKGSPSDSNAEQGARGGLEKKTQSAGDTEVEAK